MRKILGVTIQNLVIWETGTWNLCMHVVTDSV